MTTPSMKSMREEALRILDLPEKSKVARKLTTKARKNLDSGAFVFPKDRRYPIHDESHARNALARASGKPEEAQVRAAVHSRFPGIGKEKEAGLSDRVMKAGTALGVAGSLGMAGYAGRREYGAMAGGALDAARQGRHELLNSMKSKKIGKFPLLKGKSASVEDAAEQAHNVLINTHFFLKDNRDGLHPAHARRVRELETGMRTLVKELDQYAPRTAHTYADGHAENCKTASVGGWAAGKAQNAAKYLRSLPHAIPRNVGNTVKGFANPVASMRKGWHSDNNLGRALTVGFAGMDAMDAMKKNDPSGRGRGRAERVGAAIGNTAGGLVGLPHGTFSGGAVGSAIGSYVGGKAGRMVDGAVKVVRKPSVPKPVVPVEAR
jgi:hypothetical protein